MTRARSSIVQKVHRSQLSLNRRLRRWLAKELKGLRGVIGLSAMRCRAEHYRKHFGSFGHASLLLFHGLSGGASLRQSFVAFAACEGLVSLSGLMATNALGQDELGVSFSQFAASNTSRPAEFLGGIIPYLVKRVRHREGRMNGHIPANLRMLDTTFLAISLKLAPWVKVRGHVAGVQLQVEYVPALDLPEYVVLTDSHANDYNRLDEAIMEQPARLVALRGQTLVVDLGYYSHRRFECLSDAGVHWLSRLNKQATVHVHQKLPLPQTLPLLDAGRITILKHQVITLGSPNNRAGAVLQNVRRVTARVEPHPKAAKQGDKPVIYDLVTDRWDLDTIEVVQAYVWRWQIEIFFRWLKSHVHLTRWLGYSANAVALTVYLAIVIHLLCALVTRDLGLRQRTPALLRQMAWTLAQLTSDDIPQEMEARQLTFPGWMAKQLVPT